jgi:hypothetical protein
VCVKALLYADDVAVVAKTPGQLAVAARVIQSWCEAFGMLPGHGAGKTEAMAFFRPSSEKAPPSGRLGTFPRLPTASARRLASLPEITMGTVPIRWTQRYRYLGFVLSPDLDPTEALAHASSVMTTAWTMTFAVNGTLCKAPPALILEVFNTCVVGVANFWLSLLAPSAELVSVFNRLRFRTAAIALRTSRHMPRAILASDARLPSVEGIHARESARLLLELQTSAFDTLAARLVAHMSLCSDSNRGPRRSWVHAVLRAQTSLADELGIGKPTVDRRRGVVYLPSSVVPRATAAWGRAVTYERWRRASIVSAYGPPAAVALLSVPGPAPAPTLRLANAPSAHPTQHAATLHFSYVVPSAGLFATHGYTTLSVCGPHCSGGVLSLVTDPSIPDALIRALVSMRAGRAGLFVPDVAPPCMQYPDVSLLRRFRSLGTTASAAQERWRAASMSDRRRVMCPLCRSSDALSPSHVLCSCPHPIVAAARAAVQAAMPDRVRALVCSLHVAQARAARGGGTSPLPDAVFASCVAAAESAHDLASWSLAGPGALRPDSAFVFFRLVTALPWPASVLGDPQAAYARPLRLARFLAATFDATRVPHSYLRKPVNSWVRWAGRACVSLLTAWSAGVQTAWLATGGSPEPCACFTRVAPFAPAFSRLTPLCGFPAPPPPAGPPAPSQAVAQLTQAAALPAPAPVGTSPVAVALPTQAVAQPTIQSP